MCTWVCMDWTLGENFWSHSFILRHHTLFFLEKGSVTGLGSPIRLHRLSDKPQDFSCLQFPSTDHNHTALPFFFMWILGVKLWFSHLWDQHLIGQAISLVHHFFLWSEDEPGDIFPHFPLRELEGRCFQIVIMELKARLLGRLNLVTFVIFPNPRISIITQTHGRSCTHALTHSFISIKEAGTCHKWTQLLNSISLMPAPCRPGMVL